MKLDLDHRHRQRPDAPRRGHRPTAISSAACAAQMTEVRLALSA
jgi:hypothetical protein